MRVNELTDATFEKYAINLLQRLTTQKDDLRPTVWAPVGGSGNTVAEKLLDIGTKYLVKHPWLSTLKVVQIGWHPATETHVLEEKSDVAILEGARVMLVDSVVNSGITLQGAHDLVRSVAPSAEITAFALAVRHAAVFVPNIFSLLIGPSDRLFLPWHEERPNNRLVMSASFGLLAEADLNQPPIDTSAEFMNRASWADRWFSMKTDPNRRVLVCRRRGELAAFINFKVDLSQRDLQVDEVGTSKAHVKNGLAGALMRYAETFARAEGCSQLTLWAHDSVIKWYEEDFNFSRVGTVVDCGTEGKYSLMKRQLGSSKEELEIWLQGRRKKLSSEGRSPEAETTSVDRSFATEKEANDTH